MYHNNNSHFEMYNLLHSKINRIYLFHTLATFARNLIGIFVPVYLYKLGYSLSHILMYSIIQSIIVLSIIPLSVYLIKKIGFRFTLLTSVPFFIIQVTMLNFVSNSYVFFILAALSFGLFAGIFWPAYHSEISIMGSSKHRGSQMGTIQILTIILSTLTPIISGFILDFSSFWYLLMLVTIIMVLSVIPLLFTKEKKLKNYSFQYKDYIRLIKSKKYKNSKKVFSYNGMYSTLTLYVWPIILFILLDQSYFNYGLLITFVSIISTIFILYIKAYLDIKNKNNFLKYTNMTLSINWIFKSIIFFFSIMFLYIIESIYKLSQNMFNMIFFSIFYNNAKKSNYLDYIILREVYLHTTRILLSLGLIFIFFIFYESLLTFCGIVLIGTFVSIGFNCFNENDL